MAAPGPIPVLPQGANPEPRYEYKAWPAWYYRADGRGEIFNSAEEVPDGWFSLDELNAMRNDPVQMPQDDDDAGGEKDPVDPSLLKAEERPRQLTRDQRKEAVETLRDGNTQSDLVKMLEAMQALDDSIEFSASWPKQKLADAIVDNGGPLDPEEN